LAETKDVGLGGSNYLRRVESCIFSAKMFEFLIWLIGSRIWEKRAVKSKQDKII
jgi:hypothetical protein